MHEWKSAVRVKHCQHKSLAENMESLANIVSSNACDDSKQQRLRDRLLLQLMRRADTGCIDQDEFIEDAVGESFGALKSWMHF